MTTQSLRRSPEPVVGLGRVYVSGPITALAAELPLRKVTLFFAVDARRVRKDVIVP